MPNVSWQEPQVLVDVLAINLLSDENGMQIPGSRRVSVVSPWFSEVELSLRPGPWHRHLQIEHSAASYNLSRILQRFLDRKWRVDVAVLAYGKNPCGITKEAVAHFREREVLRRLMDLGANIHLVPDLHAKGVVTPLGLITGSTNLTNSGLFLQAQNAMYFAHDHAEFPQNEIQLRARFDYVQKATDIP